MFYTKKTIDTMVGNITDQAFDLTQRLTMLENSLPEMIQTAIAADKQARVAAQEKADDDRQNSDVPFVEIISDGYDPELGVQLQLDWNMAFVKELKAKGYKGRNDREIVNKWLIEMHKQLATQFEEQDKV